MYINKNSSNFIIFSKKIQFESIYLISTVLWEEIYILPFIFLGNSLALYSWEERWIQCISIGISISPSYYRGAQKLRFKQTDPTKDAVFVATRRWFSIFINFGTIQIGPNNFQRIHLCLFPLSSKHFFFWWPHNCCKRKKKNIFIALVGVGALYPFARSIALRIWVYRASFLSHCIRDRDKCLMTLTIICCF